MNTELVKQAQIMLNKLGMNVTREEAYQELLKQNFINIDGSPTQWALDNGLIGQVYRYEFPNGLKKTKMTEEEAEDHDMHEVFSRMPKKAFINDRKNDDYLIDAPELIKAIKGALIDGNLTSNGRKKWQKVLKDLERNLKNGNQ